MRPVIDEDMLAECLCEDCPSYPKAVFPKKDGVYCVSGHDPRIADRKGCNCKRCSVYADSGASGSFFCIDGPAD